MRGGDGRHEPPEAGCIQLPGCRSALRVEEGPRLCSGDRSRMCLLCINILAAAAVYHVVAAAPVGEANLSQRRQALWLVARSRRRLRRRDDNTNIIEKGIASTLLWRGALSCGALHPGRRPIVVVVVSLIIGQRVGGLQAWHSTCMRAW